MEEGLKLKISADLGNTIAQLRELQKQFRETGASGKGLGDSVGNTTKQLPKLGDAAKGTNIALVNTGRVIQDLPYGLIGVANNIDPLIASFQQLKATTGSTGSAFKAMAAGLLGPAGVAIAVSSITSALIAFGPAISDAISGVTSLTKAFDEVGGGSAEAFKKAELNFAKLSDIINEPTNSAARQQAALNKLNAELKDYGLKVTDVATFQKSASQIGALYAQIKQEEAKGTALAAVAAQEYSKQILAQVKLLDAQSKIISLKSIPGLGGAIPSLIQQFKKSGAEDVIKDATTIQNKFGNEIANSNNRITDLINQMKSITGVVEDFGGKQGGATDKTKAHTKATTELTQSLLAQQGAMLGIRGYLDENIKLYDQFNRRVSEFQLPDSPLQKPFEKVDLTGANRAGGLNVFDNLSGKTDGIKELSKLTKDLNKDFALTDELINTVGNEFANLFTNLSKDGTKAFEDLAKSIAQTTTRILINYAVTQALKTLLDSIAPGVGTAAGNALDTGFLAGVTSGGGGGGTIRADQLRLAAFGR